MNMKNWSYQLKMFVIFSITILFIGTCTFLGFYLYLQGNIRKNSSTSMQQISDKIATSFDYAIQNANMTASQVSANTYIQDIMLRANQQKDATNYFDQNIKDSNTVVQYLSAISSPLLTSARISVFDRYYNYINYGYLNYTKTDSSKIIASYDLLHRFDREEQGFVLLPPAMDHWNVSSASQIPTFSLVREIYDLDTPSFPKLGYVEVQQPYTLLESICTDGIPSQYTVQILDKAGRVVYPFSPDSAQTPVILPEALGELKSNSIKIHSTIVYCCSETISPWTIVLYQDKDLFLSPEILVRNYMFLTLMLFYIISAIIIFIVTQSMTKPIRSLVKRLETVSIDHTSVELDLHNTNNEFIMLHDALETTLERLSDTSKRELQAQANASYSHMLALQAQMNPHFLYNTLMVLNGLAMQKEYQKISKMCTKLSHMLRYSAAYSEQNTTIQQECDYARAYLELMKMRYDDFLEYDIQTDTSINEVTIPKLLIQPMIENAFKHGFSDTLPPYQIYVRVWQEDSFWKATICDNGCGFSADVMKHFYDAIDQYDPASDTFTHVITNTQIGGSGLKNLYARMKLYYDNAFIFHIDNQPDGGGRVTIGGRIYAEDSDSR